MDTLTTIFQGLLTLLFAGSGAMKLALPYKRFTQLPFQGWATDFEPLHIRVIGLGEVAAGITMAASLIVSSSGVAGTAAVGMALFMSGAATAHLRRSEYANMVGNFGWLGLALVVAYQSLIAGG